LNKFIKILKSLGPGLLFSGAAIGVSHLVQATRAGANFQYGLIWAVIAIHIVKYPFFQFAPRYVAATGNNLIDGYHKLGKWAMTVFLIVTIGTIFTIQATVTMVTAGLVAEIFQLHWPVWIISSLVLLVCAALLYSEKFLLLEKSIKFIILLLTIATIIAVIAISGKTVQPVEINHFHWNKAGILFLIALMGWMPSPLDLSVWLSIWNQEKGKSEGHRVEAKESLRDFNIGYWGTLIIAVFFLLLGAMAIYGRGIPIPQKASAFAGFFINMYTESIGGWAYWVIGIAALTTMASTTLTCFDAIPRVLQKSTAILIPKTKPKEVFLYRLFMVILGIGSVFIIGVLARHMIALITVTTVLAFLTTPLLAIMNYMVINSAEVPALYRINPLMKILSWVGIVFLFGFSIAFIWVQWM
jgi:Mn2+/Fe2+ NRAMP family transporter